MDSYARSTHIWKSPAHPSFYRESRICSAAREIVDFFFTCDTINLLFIIPLFSTDERWGWRMGGNVFTVTMTRRVCGSCSSSSFPLSVSLLLPCNKSAVLCLLTQFCVAAIDPPLGAEFTTILGACSKALNVFFVGFLSSLVRDAQHLYIQSGWWSISHVYSPPPPSLLDWNLFLHLHQAVTAPVSLAHKMFFCLKHVN